MNKLLIGSIAGAAGIALLLGGAGTFALWNSAASIAGGTVASGTLTIESDGAPVWTDGAAGPAIATIADVQIVPGDTLVLTQDVLINATGDNLQAILTFDDSTITTDGSADEDLKAALDITLTATGAGVSPAAAQNEFSVTPSGSESTVTLTLTVALPSSVDGVDAQGGTVDLTDLGFTLTQVG